MKVEYELSPARREQVYRFYFDEWWTKARTPAEADEALANSYVCVVVNDADEAVGFARAISDGVFFAWVADVIARPDQRGTGVGAAIMDGITAHPELQRVKKWDLSCRPEMDEFYARWGSSTRPRATVCADPHRRRSDSRPVLAPRDTAWDRSALEQVEPSRRGQPSITRRRSPCCPSRRQDRSFRLVRVAGVTVDDDHRPALDVEPQTSTATELMLPALMNHSVTNDGGEIALERMILL